MSDTPTTLWESIAGTLTHDIQAGHFAPGDKLPTEADLSRRFGVNRHTVRHALAHLAEQGLTYSRRGSGVFVAAKPTSYPLGRRVRFHRNLIAAGQSPKRQILSLLTRAADEAETKALELTKGAQVHAIEGINLADDTPMALFRSIFPADRFPGLLDELAAKSSITEALASRGVTDHLRRSTEITAKLATPTQALHLKLRDAAPILRTVAINTDPGGTPIEYGTAWFAGDRVSLTVPGGEDQD